jgi:hypothetical protein
MKSALRTGNPLWAGLLISLLFIPLALHAKKNDVMGKIQFNGTSNIERTSGVWVDGEYVGYLKELKGSKSVLLLPGVHTISVRQDGYQDFSESVQIQPRQTQVVNVVMKKALMGTLPPVLATLKVAVNPSRAAVFVDGLYVGHVGEFEGLGRGMLVAPGAHKIKIALAGYQTFQTEINAAAKQKVEIKTDLLKSDGPLAAPLVKTEANVPAPPDSRETANAEAH